MVKGRVGICVPSGRGMGVGFVQSLVGVMNCADMEWRSYFLSSSLIQKSRRILVERAIEGGCEWIWMVDDDMVFGEEVLNIMVGRGVPVVAANATTRRFPCEFVAEKKGRKVVTDEACEGLEVVDRVGMGMMLIHADVFKVIERPWFMVGWCPKTGQELGEDYDFCRRCNEAGVVVRVDHDVSKMIRHEGRYQYSWEDACHGGQ